MMVAEGDSRTSGSLASPVAHLVAAAAAFTMAATNVVSSEFEQRSVVALSARRKRSNAVGSRRRRVRASGDDDVASVRVFLKIKRGSKL